MNNREREIIRDLAKRIAELAKQPIMEERRNKWYAHNDLKSADPMILVFPEGGWREIITPDMLLCEDEEARFMELNSERLLTLWKALVAVEVIMNVLQVMLNLANVSILAAFSVMLIVAGLIVVILYLLAWKKAADIWETLPTQTLGIEEE